MKKYTFTNKLLDIIRVSLFIAIGAVESQAQVIPTVPLLASNSAEPNIQMVLDDSGSMHWEIMPDDYVYTAYTFPRASGIYGGGDYDNIIPTFEDNDPLNALTRSPQVNSVYYNPSISYLPWSNEDGSLYSNANITCSDHNPFDTAKGCRDLTQNNTQTANWLNCTSSGTALTSCTQTSESRTFWPATYFRHDNIGSVWTWGNYTRVEIRSSTTTYINEGRENRTDCSNATSASCTYAEEIQNFANWYSFYRSRILTARAGIGRAFANQGSGFRLGFSAINKGTTSVDGISTETVISGVRTFTGTDREDFFTDLYGHVMEPASTPLRRALDDIGQYYSRTDAQGPWSTLPGQSGGTDLTCRQSYTILMTDGYWNSDNASGDANDNNDGTNGPTITESATTPPQTYTYNAISPFTDSRGDTLADPAMYYWKRDLRTDLTNEVPINYKDPAFWQHMVTFGVGLGVTGSINSDDAFAAIFDDSAPAITWPDPSSSNPAKLDDLLHASVNSRGGFFSASNPDEFASALNDTLSDIAKRIGSSSSIAANSTSIGTGSQVFQAKFNSAKWSGELEAKSVTVASGVNPIPTWSASNTIPLPANRKIFTTTGTTDNEFLWANLSAANQSNLTSVDILNYIRGDRSKELQNVGGTFRNRASHVLGDIVHSSPYYVKDTDTVYVGANDGMLHAFDASTGTELFSYIPSTLLAKLPSLTQPSYSHEYYVDGDIAVSSLGQTTGHNYLVSALGRGGKGLIGLDVTTPSSFSSNDVLWEYTDPSDADLGFMLGRPTIAKMNDGSTAIIIGNGYNSTSGTAALYIIDLATGSVIKKIDTEVTGDNGLSTPGVFDSDDDGDIDYIYAGDLKGNVWKFDVSGGISQWKVAFKSGNTPEPIFTATDATNPQAITAPITVSVNNIASDSNFGKRYIFFGTGSYFRSGDPNDNQVQSWYGLIDEDSQISGRSSLATRSLLYTGTFDGSTARTFETVTANDMIGKSGWYLDFDTETGERMVTSSTVHNLAVPALIASTIIPVDDPCLPEGRGFINLIDPFTGARLNQGVIDLDQSGDFSDDVLNNIVIGSYDPNIGMPSEPLIMGDRLIVGGTDGTTDDRLVDLGTAGDPEDPTLGSQPNKRINWREIILE